MRAEPLRGLWGGGNERLACLPLTQCSLLLLLLTVLAVMSMLAQGTETEVTAARKLNTSATILTGIVLTDRYLTGRPHVAGWAFAFPFLSLVAVLVQLV